MPGGEPFFFPGGDTGCLLLHGLNAVPQEMLWLGKYLRDTRGHTIYGPRIVGHGTTVQDLRRMTWEDWYGSALDVYRLLRQICRRVFVLGLSNGGLLSLHLGTREAPDAVVDLAGPLVFDQPLMPYARYLKIVWRYTAKDTGEGFQRMDRRMRAIQAEQEEPVIGRRAYGQFPLASLAQLYALMQITTERLPWLTCPLLLIYSEGDRTVPVRNMELVASRAGTPPEHLHRLLLKESDHLLTLDVEKDTVFEAVGSFLDRYV
jgi:carboxylesterase